MSILKIFLGEENGEKTHNTKSRVGSAKVLRFIDLIKKVKYILNVSKFK